MRRQGYLEAQIAARYGVSQQAVSKAILIYVRTLPVQSADELRRIEAERLDSLYAALLLGVAKSAPCCIEVAVLISERRSNLLGLDAPNTHRITGANDGPVQITSLFCSRAAYRRAK